MGATIKDARLLSEREAIRDPYNRTERHKEKRGTTHPDDAPYICKTYASIERATVPKTLAFRPFPWNGRRADVRRSLMRAHRRPEAEPSAKSRYINPRLDAPGREQVP